MIWQYIIYITRSTAHVGIGREVLVRWNLDCSRKLSDAPQPPRGGRGLGKKGSRGAWRRLHPIGEEIVRCSRHHRCSLENPPGMTK